MEKKPSPWVSLDNTQVLPSPNCLIIEINCNSTPDRGRGRPTVLEVRKQAGADNEPASASGCSLKPTRSFSGSLLLVGRVIADWLAQIPKVRRCLLVLRPAKICSVTTRTLRFPCPATFLVSSPRRFFFCLPTCNPGCRQNEFQVTYVGVDFF